MVIDTHLLQGCGKCSQSFKTELPAIKKKIIYLDQFFYSEAFKGQSAPFIKAAEEIQRLSNQQLIIAPFSSIHEHETHQWEHRVELYDFIKHTSRGHKFKAAYDVQQKQILKGFKGWLSGLSSDYTIEESDAFDNDIHKWEDYFWIDVGKYLGDIELIKDLKAESIDGLLNCFDDWRESSYSFEEDVKFELNAAAKGYMDSYLEYVARIGAGDYDALLDSPITSTLVERLIHILPKTTPPPQALRLCMTYMHSETFAKLPYLSIEATTFATLKAMVKEGAYANREKAKRKLRGFFNDVGHIATYAPYCDAFVMDKAMAELMKKPQIALEDKYNVKVFSLNNWDKLFEWLADVQSSITQEHQNALALAYP